jgi:hypothetical protein
VSLDHSHAVWIVLAKPDNALVSSLLGLWATTADWLARLDADFFGWRSLTQGVYLRVMDTV